MIERLIDKIWRRFFPTPWERELRFYHALPVCFDHERKNADLYVDCKPCAEFMRLINEHRRLLDQQ